MLWLLQNNLVDTMTARLAWALQRTGRPLRDFSMTDEPGLLASLTDPRAPHFFYGSTGMLRQLQALPEFSSRLFGDARGLDQRCWLTHRQEDLLNPQCELLTLGELRAALDANPDAFGDRFFIRPAVDQKAFAGQVVSRADLSGLYLGRKGRVRAHAPDLLLALSPVVDDIQAEYRLVVLDHVVRLGSRYRFNGALSLDPNTPAQVLERSQELATGWLPADFVVMDVAVRLDGRVQLIEFNSVHSSGLYAIAPERYADLVEEALPRKFPTSSQN